MNVRQLISAEQIAKEANLILGWHLEAMGFQLLIGELREDFTEAPVVSIKHHGIRSTAFQYDLERFSKLYIAPAVADLAEGIHEQGSSRKIQFERLYVPEHMDMAARSDIGGISVRFVRGFDINKDSFLSRFDVAMKLMA